MTGEMTFDLCGTQHLFMLYGFCAHSWKGKPMSAKSIPSGKSAVAESPTLSALFVSG